MYNYSSTLPVDGKFDVIVVGSGSAGSAAAVAAARNGAKTLLVEKMPFLGGTSTAVLDTFYGFYTPGEEPVKVVEGIPGEVVENLMKFDACFERPNSFGAGTGITYHPEYLKIVWENMVAGSGCAILLNAWVQDVIQENGRITGLVAATKAGLAIYETDMVVDASGDADVCYLAALPFELAGAVDPAQTLTTTFKMVNVDDARRKKVPKLEINRMMTEAAETGKYNLPRKEGSDHITPVEGMRATIMTRLKSFEKVGDKTINAVDPWFLSRSEMEGRKQALEYIRFLRDYVPGYEHAALSTFGFQIGIRETRRIYGEYRLTGEDVLTARQFGDQIGLCGAPMEDHHEGEGTSWQYLPERKYVGIPYRTLIPKNTNNILVAGRCFSSNHVAHTAVRSMAQCMAMGEAAGTAAGLAVRDHKRPVDIDYQELRNVLRSNGVLID